MSRIKGKIRNVLAEGEASRKTITPKVGGAPLRVYRWWARETGNEYLLYSKFSFCHYFWVVVFWAPLLRVVQVTRLDRLFDKFSMSHFVSSVNFGKITMGYVVFMLLVMPTTVAIKIWPDVGWWSLIVAPVLLVLACVITAAAIAVIVFGVIGVANLVEVIKRRRVADLSSRVNIITHAAGMVRSAGRTTGEFAVLVGQSARVKKWKICPMVEISPEG